jgi:hypothetical protein
VYSNLRLNRNVVTQCFNVPYGARVLSYDTQPFRYSSDTTKGFAVFSYGQLLSAANSTVHGAHMLCVAVCGGVALRSVACG